MIKALSSENFCRRTLVPHMPGIRVSGDGSVTNERRQLTGLGAHKQNQQHQDETLAKTCGPPGCANNDRSANASRDAVLQRSVVLQAGKMGCTKNKVARCGLRDRVTRRRSHSSTSALLLKTASGRHKTGPHDWTADAVASQVLSSSSKNALSRRPPPPLPPVSLLPRRKSLLLMSRASCRRRHSY